MTDDERAGRSDDELIADLQNDARATSFEEPPLGREPAPDTGGPDPDVAADDTGDRREGAV